MSNAIPLIRLAAADVKVFLCLKKTPSSLTSNHLIDWKSADLLQTLQVDLNCEHTTFCSVGAKNLS